MGLDTKTYRLTDRQSQCDLDFDLDLDYDRRCSIDNKNLAVSLKGPGAKMN
jgi:hypothetical protein